MQTVDQVSKGAFETLLVIFFNSTLDRNGDVVVTSKWLDQLGVKALKGQDRKYQETADALSSKYGLLFSRKTSVEISATLMNESKLGLEEVQKNLYLEIIQRIPSLPEDYPLDEELALALFLLRGSPDTKFGYYSVDVKRPTAGYVVNVEKVLMSSEDLWSRLNFNFRDLQPQFTAGQVLRNSQIRVNLKWFYDKVMVKNPQLNPYKFQVLVQKKADLGEIRQFHSFEKRMQFYRSRMLGRALNSNEIESLRKELLFRDEITNEDSDTPFNIRNQRIISLARETFEDICVGCDGTYPIDHRTFLMPRNGRYYLEVNHVVPFASGSNAVDVLDNLVKLCPTCHRALAPYRAAEKLQREIINKMIESRPEVRAFVTSRANAFGQKPADYIYANLK